MIIDMPDTTTADVNKSLVELREEAGVDHRWAGC